MITCPAPRPVPKPRGRKIFPHAGRFLMALVGLVVALGADWSGAPPEPLAESGQIAVDTQHESAGIEWIRSGKNTDRWAWGIRGNLRWGLAPPTGKPVDGPRGLIRIRYPVLPDGQDDLLNFIAVEPIVNGRKHYSELEPSQLDDLQGKRFWVARPPAPADHGDAWRAGRLTRCETGVESLEVQVQVERFLNGAHVWLTITQRSDLPDELQLTVHAHPDSAPMDYCILTATMGNKARARHLWLDDRVVSSLELYPDYREAAFTDHQSFPLDQLYRNAAGDVLVAITTDEQDPSAIEPFPRRTHWYYGGFPVTQYWRKPAGHWRDDLHVAVNARYTYWMSKQPIPGGISYENFELRERFYDGQRFHFGITTDPGTTRPRIMRKASSGGLVEACDGL